MLFIKHCPQCGSKNVRKSKSRSATGGGVSFFFNQFRCRECRHRYRRMRWTAAVASLAGLSLFAGTVFSIKQLVSGDIFGKRDSGQQWDVAGEPTMELKRKARLGDTEAQFQLGFWHRQINRSIDDKQAVEWFKRAADKGNADAQYYLALHYADGRGVLQDFNESGRLITALAAKNHADAQSQLGAMYRRGLGVRMDKSKSYLWYNLAASNGNRDAGPFRDLMASQLSTIELGEAQRNSRMLEQFLRDGKGLGQFAPVLATQSSAEAAAPPPPAPLDPALTPSFSPSKTN